MICSEKNPFCEQIFSPLESYEKGSTYILFIIMYLCMMGGWSFYVSVGYFECEFMTYIQISYITKMYRSCNYV